MHFLKSCYVTLNKDSSRDERHGDVSPAFDCDTRLKNCMCMWHQNVCSSIVWTEFLKCFLLLEFLNLKTLDRLSAKFFPSTTGRISMKLLMTFMVTRGWILLTVVILLNCRSLWGLHLWFWFKYFDICWVDWHEMLYWYLILTVNIMYFVFGDKTKQQKTVKMLKLKAKLWCWT